MKPISVLMWAIVIAGPFFTIPTAANALCTDMSATQSRPIVIAFLNRPVGLLERFPFGGPDLINRLSAILAADVRGTLPSVVETIRASNHTQKEAVGTALGRTNAGCLKYGDSRSSELIGAAVSRMTDSVVRSTYYAITAGITDPDRQDATKDPSTSPARGAKLPVGRLPSPFAPQQQSDPNRPLAPIR